ncbi:MAG: hypothetical protein Q9M94_01595 [Candidatus Gracilibacteria bacterium]|nr:hypothetical protein [Candidatus Gracilibacteria bacterium]
MKSKINKILEDISSKKEELITEYEKAKEKYGFNIVGKKIIWKSGKETELKRSRKSVWNTIFTAEIREILSIPFIWIMLFPALILDFCLFIYQNTAIRLYKIPLAKRSDYIVFDRKQLAYLNWIQKINCIYCSYINGLFQYSVEVAGRTEKYWCPIKHARKKEGFHDWEKHFADYGDAEGFKETFCNIEEFKKLNK